MNTKGIILKPEFEKAIFDLGFSEYTEIQEKCIPLIQQGKDVIGLSFTGSGKTAAFGFPALEMVTPGKGIQLLVLVPTRELCNQVTKEFRKFAKYRKTYILEIYGGVSINPQIEHLRHTDVVIGTPGRLLDHLSRRTLNMANIKILVLDEADKMFEMGFIDDVKKIVSMVPRNSQKLFFGATIPLEIMNIAKNYMINPERVKMQTYVDKSKLIQHYYDVMRKDKFSLLVHIIKKDSNGLTIVFCGTRHTVDIINKNLNKHNVNSQALHGGISQNNRNRVMEAFHDKRLDVLVASDVAARGLDIKNLNLVINYDPPKTSREYVHRIGRTARAGSEGKVISLLSPEDHSNFRRVLEDRSLFIHKMKTPYFEYIELIKPQHNNRAFHRRFPKHRNR
ncbi:MAG: DEAD/DEAH box helicase [Nanoarchaeota archaeon]